jgi:hypothetical protein
MKSFGTSCFGFEIPSHKIPRVRDDVTFSSLEWNITGSASEKSRDDWANPRTQVELRRTCTEIRKRIQTDRNYLQGTILIPT